MGSNKNKNKSSWSQFKNLFWGKPNQKSAGATQRKKARSFKTSGKPSLADQMGLGNRYKK